MANTINLTVDPAKAVVQISTHIDGYQAYTIKKMLSTGQWVPVRNADPTDAPAGDWAGFDSEVPLDDPFSYVVLYGTPEQKLFSSTVTIDGKGRTILLNPGKPTLTFTDLLVEALPSLTYPADLAVFEVLGRTFPLSAALQRKSARGELTFHTYTQADRRVVLDMVADGQPLFLSTSGAYDVGAVYIAVQDVVEERRSAIGTEHTRRWHLPFIVTDRPIGPGLTIANTWQKVWDGYGIWSELLAPMRSWEDVLTKGVLAPAAAQSPDVPLIGSFFTARPVVAMPQGAAGVAG